MNSRKWLASLIALCLLTVVLPFAATAEDAPVKISVAGYFFGPVENDVITPAVEQMLKEKHGINVEIEIVYIEYAEYKNLLSQRIIGQTAPDVFLPSNYSTMLEYYDQGAIAGWDPELFMNNAPDVYAFITGGTVDGRVLDAVDMWKEYAMVGDKMVTIPKISEDGSMPYKTLIYRGDWIDALGVTQLPKTVDEFVDLLYRFAKEDPDGNGQDDTYGMSITGIQALFGAYGISTGFVNGNSYWQLKDGRIVSPDISAEAKEVVSILAQLYADGILDPEFVAGDEGAGADYWAFSVGMINGQYGASANASIDHYRLKEVLNDAGGRCAQEYWAVNGEDAAFVYAPWPAGPNGDYGWRVGYAVSNGENAVYNKALENDPEKLATIFKIMNAFAIDDELYKLASYGIEGEHYTLNEEGIMIRSQSDAESNRLGIMACRSLYGADRAYSTFAYNQAFYKQPSIANRLNWFKEDQYTSYIQDAVSTVLSSQSDLLPELNRFRDETYIEMIRGERSLDEWDDFAAEYMALGGEQLSREANEWYQSK
jgi:putative aldouronate transport system substrate-binding protein